MNDAWTTPALEEIMQSLNQIAAEFDASDDDAEAQRFDEELARLNRSGTRGRDWAVLQGRIDMNQTTLTSILSGEDPSPEAQRVAGLARTNLASLSEQMSEDAETSDDALDPAAEAAELLDDVYRRVDEIKSRFNIN